MVPELLGSEQYSRQPDRLSVTFAALADPTRRALLAQLAAGNASVAELAKPFSIGVRAVSKHLGVLERAGLVRRGRDAQRRPSYIDAAPLLEVRAWIEGYRRLWEQRLDQLDALLDTVQKEEQ
jgi:DNA-binding transcriptional ArsR family regulator